MPVDQQALPDMQQNPPMQADFMQQQPGIAPLQ